MIFNASSSTTSKNFQSEQIQEDVLFWVTDKLTIYKINPRDMLSSTNMKRPQKLKLPNYIMINQMQIHPNFPLLFA